MASTATRRQLVWTDLEEVIADVDRLASSGHKSSGKWNLTQCCGHLADWMTFPLEGFPKPPWPIRLLLIILKPVIGQRQLRKMLRSRVMPKGIPTSPETVYLSNREESEEIARLKRAIAKLQASDGPYHSSPLFGDMSREDLFQLQVIHAAHHLSFLTPMDTEGT